ncbi:MAG: hypothetical protein Q7R62_02450 [bacterium]|nr:hypothetical protein [bacterium]
MKRTLELILAWAIMLVPVFVWIYSDPGMLWMLIIILIAPCLYVGTSIIRKGITLK